MILKKPAFIVGAAIVCLITFGVYWTSRPVPGIETKGPDETVAWISLATAIASSLTSVVGLVMKFLETRRKPG